MSFFDQVSKMFPLPSVSDYRLLAKKRLPRPLFEFIDGGAFNEVTMRQNAQDYEHIQLRKRVLRNVSQIDTKITLFGQEMDQPLILAPIGFAGVYARRGEVQAARAAEKANVPFCLSAVGICSMEEIRLSTAAPFWYQFYMLKEKKDSLELLQRAEAAGCSVLVLTVDLPAIGARNRYHRSLNHRLERLPFLKRSLENLSQFFWHSKWFMDVRVRGRPLALGNMPLNGSHATDLPSMRKWMSSQLCPAFSWQDLNWVRENWTGKILLKGIMDPEDAYQALTSGVDGIIVSNHGARHLDGTPSTISILPTIVEAVDRQLPILIDGGISSGLDVVKALALGAKACMIGRAWTYGLAARGEAGVSEVISLLNHELKVVMTQLGTISIKEIDHRILYNKA